MAHGTASWVISLSLITWTALYRVGVPRMTGHSFMLGSSRNYGYLILVIPLDTRDSHIHNYKPQWLHFNPTYAVNGRQFSSNFLGESFQSIYLEASFHCIVRSHKIELSSIVQQTSSEFVVYESFTLILRTNEASKRVWIQTGYALGSFH